MSITRTFVDSAGGESDKFDEDDHLIADAVEVILDEHRFGPVKVIVVDKDGDEWVYRRKADPTVAVHLTREQADDIYARIDDPTLCDLFGGVLDDFDDLAAEGA